GRLVGFNRDQALLKLDTVADGDHDLDHLYVGRITDIGHDHRSLTTRARTALLCSVRRLGGRGLLGPYGRWLRGWNRRFFFFGGRRLGALAGIGSQFKNDGALGNLVTDLDLDGFDDPRRSGGNLHGSLVGLHGDQALFLGNRVALGHQHLDHVDFSRVADIRHLDFY